MTSLNNTIESWRTIPAWENFYEASSLGNIRSCIRIIKRKSKGKGIQVRPYGGKVLKPKTNRNGYLEVTLWSNNKGKTKSVHTLVCSAFYGNSNKEVNHKDGNKKNNCKDNLEWMTRKENIQDRDSRKTPLFKLEVLTI